MQYPLDSTHLLGTLWHEKTQKDILTNVRTSKLVKRFKSYCYGNVEKDHFFSDPGLYTVCVILHDA